MKVLFVCGGNSKFFNIIPFIKSQGESLEAAGLDITYFRVKGKGAINYLRNVRMLKSFLQEHPVDIIHAHYSLSGWVAVLASPNIPIVLSLMGSDAVLRPKGIDIKSRLLLLTSLLIQPFCRAIISKSPNIEKAVWRKNISYRVPNGVQLNTFKNNLDRKEIRTQLNLEADKKYVLFLGNPADPNKNIALVEAALQQLNRPDVVLLKPYKIKPHLVPYYLIAADVFTLCSFREGSSNVLKEAMTSNCPLVSTDVGDASWIIEQTAGCHLASFDPSNFATQLNKALIFSEKIGRTKGRQRIINLGLDTRSIADKIISIYKTIAPANEQVAL